LEQPDPGPHRFLLEQELDRATHWLAQEMPETSPLMLVVLTQKNVERVDSPGVKWLLLAQWAWSAELEDPEKADAAKLVKQLEDRQIAWQSEPPELGLKFPAMPQDDREWQARLALVKYSRAEAVTFQGTGELMIRTGPESQPADLGPMMAKLMQSQVQSLLDELSGKRAGANSNSNDPHHRWMRVATTEADRIERDYLRATSVTTSPVNGTAVVETGFSVKFRDGEWESIWFATDTQNADAQDRAAIERIEKDPQIESLRKTLSGFGLGAGNEQIDQAIRIGAATMRAQQNTDSQFEKFRQRYQHRLDLPILRWNSTAGQHLPNRSRP
jgi:hypothetical protein